MKHYFVTASFKGKYDGQFITQFDFFCYDFSFCCIDEALCKMVKDVGIKDLEEFLSYDLVHFSISTF